MQRKTDHLRRANPIRRRLLRDGIIFPLACFLPRIVLPADRQFRFTSDPFTLGVASGFPAMDSIVLWTRLAPEPLAPDGGVPPVTIPVGWEVSEDEKMRRVVRKGTAYAEPGFGHAVHVEVTGLRPDSHYFYRFIANGAGSQVGRTRTAPAAGSMKPIRLAFCCCQMFEHGYYTAYREIVRDNPDLIVHVGDYIYELSWGKDPVRHHVSGEAYTLGDYRVRYAQYKLDPDLRAAHAAAPWVVTWDDHEVDNDYTANISEEDDDPALFLARRAAAYQAYYEHLPLPRRAVPFGSSMRLYTDLDWGGLARLYLLDGRQYRSPHPCPKPGHRGGSRVSHCPELYDSERTMLGRRQEEWLSSRFAASSANWNLLAQQTVMTHCDEDPGPGRSYWTDSWNGYPAARRRLIEELDRNKVTNPVILSGDIHAFIIAGLNRIPEDLHSPTIAPEFVTTSISSYGPSRRLIETMRANNPQIKFADGSNRGYLRIDLEPERMRVDLVAVDTGTPDAVSASLQASFLVEDGNPEPRSI